jgi:hypothetical protein
MSVVSRVAADPDQDACGSIFYPEALVARDRAFINLFNI